MRSSRFRRFAIVSLAGNIIAAVFMVALYHYVALQNFEEIRTEQNMELARSVSNTIVDDVVELQALAATSSWAELQASPEIERFAEDIERDIDQLQVYELNIFDTNGLVLYSTDRQRIGAKDADERRCRTGGGWRGSQRDCSARCIQSFRSRRLKTGTWLNPICRW